MGLSAITLALAKKHAERIVSEKSAAVEAAISDAIKQSKIYTDSLVSQLISFNIKLVETLPSVDEAKENTIYLVKKENISETNDLYYEYLLIEGKWEFIGTTNISDLDLSDYWTIQQVKDYVDNKTYSIPIASATNAGIVKVDMETISITDDGTISVIESKTQNVAEGVAQTVIDKNFVTISDDEISNLF